MKRVYCLYRVFTKGQVDQDDIPIQKIKCREFAQTQGWSVLKEFSEKGISGYKVSSEDRDAIQDLRAPAMRKEFDVLLVFMFDRLGRRENETPFVVEWFTQQGVEVWSTQEGEQRFDNHVDKLMNYIRYWQASGESAKTSIRIRTRLEQLTEEGIYTGRTLPYGYRLIRKGRFNKKGIELYDIEVDETEVIIVQAMFAKTVNEGYGSYRIAEFINQQGIRTHTGSKFTSVTVNRLLRNKMYCGYLISGNSSSERIPELQIVNNGLFDQSQFIVDQRLAKHSEDRQIAMSTKGKTLLSGNIFCAHCSGRLVVTRYQDKYQRKDGSGYSIDELKYSCYHRSRKLRPCDGQSTYQAERIDHTVEDIMEDVFQRFREMPRHKALEQRYQAQLSAAVNQKKEKAQQLDKYQIELTKLELEIGKALTGEKPLYSRYAGQCIGSNKTASSYPRKRISRSGASSRRPT